MLGAIVFPGLTPWAIVGGPSGAKKRSTCEFPDILDFVRQYFFLQANCLGRDLKRHAASPQDKTLADKPDKPPVPPRHSEQLPD